MPMTLTLPDGTRITMPSEGSFMLPMPRLAPNRPSEGDKAKAARIAAAAKVAAAARGPTTISVGVAETAGANTGIAYTKLP